MGKIEVPERRARLARRHRLAPGDRVSDVVEAARSMVCLHGTDAVTVYLSAWARVEGMTVSDLERALYGDRSQVPGDAPYAVRVPTGDAGSRPGGHQQPGRRRRTAQAIRDVEKAGLHPNGERWLVEASRHVLALLSDGREATSSELRNEIPLLEGSIAYGEGKSWGGQMPVGPRVLTTLSAAGRIVRASNDGAWTTSRPRWATTESWLGEKIAPSPEAEGVARLVELWLRAFGPGTAADIKWWLGATVAAVRRALADLGAVAFEPLGQARRLALQGAQAFRADILKHLQDNLARVALPPTTHDLPIPPRGGSGVSTGVKQLRLVRAEEVPVPLEPAHRGRIERWQEGGPRLGRIGRLQVVGQYVSDLPIEAEACAAEVPLTTVECCHGRGPVIPVQLEMARGYTCGRR
jgi:hypothetical protein